MENEPVSLVWEADENMKNIHSNFHVPALKRLGHPMREFCTLPLPFFFKKIVMWQTQRLKILVDLFQGISYLGTILKKLPERYIKRTLCL